MAKKMRAWDPRLLLAMETRISRSPPENLSFHDSSFIMSSRHLLHVASYTRMDRASDYLVCVWTGERREGSLAL